jgi:8-amino-7-oxononanoate synthase
MLKEAALRAVEKYGTGSGASRLICGSLAPHHVLEEALAEFKGTEAALSFSSGYATALGVIGALLGKEDVLVVDKLVHACIIDAARICGARLRVFRHNDANSLESILQSEDKRRNSRMGKDGATRTSRTLIVTESVFSMDGDLAPLREIVELKDRYGAWLMVDEAHATGLYGARRRGLAEAFELQDRIEIHMGTLGKALGSQGGFICGSRALVDLLINRARTFLFSTAPAPSAAAAATKAVQLVQSQHGEDRRTQLWARVDQFKNGLVGSRWKLPTVQAAIIPLIVGEEKAALELADTLRAKGFLAPAIRYPTVARGEARLRITLSAAHSPEDVNEFVGVLRKMNHHT